MLALEHSSRVPLVKDTPTRILGMDVSHGSPGRSDVPSVAAVLTMLVFIFISINISFIYPLVSVVLSLLLNCVGAFRLLALEIGLLYQGTEQLLEHNLLRWR